MTDNAGTSVPPDYLTAPVTSPPLSVSLNKPEFQNVFVEPEKPSLKPVAKVAAVGVGGVILVIVVGILSGIAPDTFKDLGIWAPVVTAAITALATFLSGYIKKA